MPPYTPIDIWICPNCGAENTRALSSDACPVCGDRDETPLKSYSWPHELSAFSSTSEYIGPETVHGTTFGNNLSSPKLDVSLPCGHSEGKGLNISEDVATNESPNFNSKGVDSRVHIASTLIRNKSGDDQRISGNDQNLVESSITPRTLERHCCSIHDDSDDECSSIEDTTPEDALPPALHYLVPRKTRKFVARIIEGIHFTYNVGRGVIICTTCPEDGESSSNSGGFSSKASGSGTTNNGSSNSRKKQYRSSNASGSAGDNHKDSHSPKSSSKRRQHMADEDRNLAYSKSTAYAAVRGHLYTCHKIHQCTRCSILFPNDEALEAHSRSLSSCQLRPRRDAFGVDRAKFNLLRSRKGKKNRSREDQWRDIYRILFPNVEEADIPSPYVTHDSVYFTNELEDLAATPQQRMMDHCRRELPNLLYRRIEAAFETYVEQDRLGELWLRFSNSRLREIIQDCFHEVVSGFDPNLNGTGVSSRSEAAAEIQQPQLIEELPNLTNMLFWAPSLDLRGFDVQELAGPPLDGMGLDLDLGTQS
ncbi:uncharacterized protein BDR25DRAFT_367961 [Lindgomyces ingoldianus]|uniref:Uncharacterized protein n=1 Tax=Lindgomyces ingoldianus TaxID=673940 RepID=A0ACB6QW30_9PLEO|nr:uncharacterized protein BDR25DRAFT_367961 [Lindgomyces ingoldianus]KAF2471209.1 hypothetical protein BDR25DRAFT_367961 [Lindgomyces ingoldianus]